MNRDRAADLLAQAAGLRIAVIGDVCLDEYLVGRPERMSREAPVPVLALTRRFCLPGGAANPAANIAALGARALQVGLIGDDPAGLELSELLTRHGIDITGLVREAARPTTIKTRVVAEGVAAPQQVARIDTQARSAPSAEVDGRLAAAVERAGSHADAVLVSDYKSGVVTEAVRDAARRVAAETGAWATVDSQGDLERFARFGLVRAGKRDVEAGLGRPLNGEADVESVARGLRADLGTRAVIISRGAEGMSVADEEGYAVIAPANVSEVFDVAGAGDTVIAYLTMALALGADVREAVELANRAAGIVVRRLGVAAPTAAEVLATF